MANNKLFYGLVNLCLGGTLYFVTSMIVPNLLSLLNIACTDDWIISCLGLLELIKIISIIIVVVGVLEIAYWYFFERKKMQSAGGMENYKICPECKTINDKNAKFCKECGYKF